MAQSVYNPVPTVAPESGGLAGGSSDYASVPEATPNAFGARIGEATQGAGQQVDQLAQKFADIYNESTARDATTKTAADMAAEQARFMQLKGNDAVSGLKQHQDNINEIVKQNSSGLSINATQLFQRDSALMVDRALFNAGAHVGEQASYAEKTSLKGAIDSGINGFAFNPNDPENIHKIFDNSISLDYSNGIKDKNVVEANASHYFGEAFTRAIEANQYSDPTTANKLFDQAVKGSYIAPDGAKIPFLDAAHLATLSEKMHSANKIANGNAAYDALLKGTALPPPVGGGTKELDVKSIVAGAAQARNADPSISLMISGLESSFGRTSDNIGGVKGLPASSPQDHANNLVTKQIEATNVANKAVGGNATPAQVYLAYQQGPGGGAALLKAAQSYPEASALDVLTPLYKTPEEAASALTGNGMPVNATARQVMNFIQNKCDSMYGSVQCNTTDAAGNKIDLSKAIIQPHIQSGVPQQPASNPIDAFQQFNDLYQSRQSVIDGLPFSEQRQFLQERLKADEANFKEAANAYRESNSQKIYENLLSKPDFYSVNDPRVTPEIKSFWQKDRASFEAANAMAKTNREISGNTESLKFGNNYTSVLQAINSHQVKNYSDLNEYVARGDLNPQGVIQAKKDMDQEYHIKELKKNAYTLLESEVTGGFSGKGAGIFKSDWERVLPSIQEIVDKKLETVPATDLFNPNKKDWIGNDIEVLKLTQKQVVDGRISQNTALATKDGPSPWFTRTLDDVKYDILNTKDPEQQRKLVEEAKKLGWKPTPQVPQANGQ